MASVLYPDDSDYLCDIAVPIPSSQGSLSPPPSESAPPHEEDHYCKPSEAPPGYPSDAEGKGVEDGPRQIGRGKILSPDERQALRNQFVTCLGTQCAQVLQGALDDPLESDQIMVDQIDRDVLMNYILNELSLLNEYSSGQQYLYRIFHALQSVRISFGEYLARYRDGLELKRQLLEESLWSIVSDTGGTTAGVPQLWDKSGLDDLYTRYYPDHAESMKSLSYVADVDAVWRNINNMVINEIKGTGNHDHRDVRENVPLTKDEIITAIKQASEVPESLKSVLTAGVEKIQMIADQFVSGARPL